MPRNVRNWWLEIEVDGRKSRVSLGPRNARGGFGLKIWQRDDGDIVKAATITGHEVNGELILIVDTHEDEILRYSTVR